MDTLKAKQLAFHGAAIITLGMLAGMPLAMALLGASDTHPQDWRVAHMEGLINGLLILACAAITPLLALSQVQARLLSFCLIFTGYSNVLYGWVRGLSGESGLDFAPPLSNQLAALLGGLPIITALLAMAMIMLGTWKKA